MFTRGGREKGGSGGWILGRDARAGACAFVAFLHLEYKSHGLHFHQSYSLQR